VRSWEPTDGLVGPLDEALAHCAAAGFSGVIRVIGAPGGTVYLADGGVAAIETPGAPGPEVVLLRSGRVPEADWEAASVAAAVAGRPLQAELVRLGLVGAGELEAVLRTAMADAMFAFADGFVDTCRAEEVAVDCALALDPSADATWLLAEALRRMHVIGALPDPALHARDRVAAVPGASPPGAVLGGGRDEILALVDGRRSGRDLAFALGHGLYAVMLQLARMREEGLVVSTARGVVPPPGDGDGDGDSGRGRTDSDEGKTPAGLPRRQKDRPAQPRGGGQPGGFPLPAVRRLLRPRADGHARPGDT
jgi:hypothetical protein